MATDNWINPHTRIEQESKCIPTESGIRFCRCTATPSIECPFRFDTAENEPAKNLQNFAKKIANFSNFANFD